MWNNTNPAELFAGTTWELLTAGKYIQSGSTPLSTGGSNSITISKANLPNIKLKVDSFNLTTQPHTHTERVRQAATEPGTNPVGYRNVQSQTVYDTNVQTGSGGGQNTGTASPSTETLGSGTALTIQPAYITLKFWRRLT